MILRSRLKFLPPHTRYTTEAMLDQLQDAEEQIARIEERMRGVFAETPELARITSLPGIGFILGTLILSEVGDVGRFATAEKLAAYAGTTPRVHASGDKFRFGSLRSDVNRYLKWAYVEAANVICMNRGKYPDRHVSRLYERIRSRKGHQKAIGAVARHLAEATFWMLTKEESYLEPQRTVASSTGA
jgi:transposase